MQYLLELLPLTIFFLIYKLYGIFSAVLSLIGTSTATLLYAFCRKKSLSKFTLYNSLIIITFSSLTIFFRDPTFIKIKRSLIHGSLGIFLLIDLFFIKKHFLQSGYKKFFETVLLTMKKDVNWHKIELITALFFFILALTNEIIWRNFSEENWVNYKIFISPIITGAFFFWQINSLRE